MNEPEGQNWPGHGGEMSSLIRSHDWPDTSLGPVQAWPQSLRTAVDILLASRNPIILIWGRAGVQIYNDSYREILGDKHPAALGQPFNQTWPEDRDTNGPIFARVYAGESLTLREKLFPVTRCGRKEEAWFSASYSPLRDEAGAVAGIFITLVETTERVRAEAERDRLEAKLRETERRRSFLEELSARLQPLADAETITAVATEMLGRHMSVHRVIYAGVDADLRATVWPDWTDGTLPSLVGKCLLDDLCPGLVEAYQRDRAWRAEDGRADPRMSENSEALEGAGVRAQIGLPLLKDGHLAALIGVHSTQPRSWTDAEIELVRQAGEYIWQAIERARAGAAVREAGELYRSLFNSIDAGFCIVEVKFDQAQRPLDYRFVEVNRAFEQQTGLVDAQGRWMRSLAPQHEQHWFDIYGAVALTGEPVRFQRPAAALNDRWYEVYAFRVDKPEARRVAILFNDITESKRAEAELAKHRNHMEELVKERTNQLEAANARLQAQIAERKQVEEELRRLAQFPRENPNPVMRIATGGSLMYANAPARTWLAALGWVADEPAPQLVRALAADAREQRQPVETEIGDSSGRILWLAAAQPRGEDYVNIYGRDTTERKRAEESLRKATEELEQRVAERTAALRAASLYSRSLIEASLDPLVTISPEGKITDVNRATELVTGVPRDRLIGSSFSDYFTEPEKADVGYRKVLVEGLVRDYPLTIRHVSGRTTDVLYNATVYRDEAGQVQGVFAAARDVTERKRMEEELRVASLYARSLIEASLDPLVTISPDGRITDVNVATELVTGVPREQLIGTNFSDYFTEPRQAELGYQRVLAEGLVRDYPLTIRHVSGSTTDVLYNATVYRDEAGEVQGVFAAARDVTERKRLEEELRVASLYARSLIEASLDPLVTISPDGKVTDVNVATELVTGVPRERLIGSSFSDYFTEPPAAEAGYQKVLAEGLVQDYPLTILHVGGRTTDVLYNATVYRNEAGDVQGVFAAARDVTERKRVEAELARYRDHLEELVRQRTGELEAANVHLQHMTAELARSNQELEQFAYVASHDLQEPLRAVTGYLGLLEQQLGEKLDDAGRHQVDGAIQGATRMHALITGLLTLSRVGTQGHSFEAADLNSILDSALEGLRASVVEAGASITRDPLPTLPVDAIQMVQLFQNLIGNALKFRGEKPPEIHISARQKPEQWVMAVRDNGIGIEPQYHERIFLIFQRLHTRRLYPGTGIGLAICKKIVERHGGAMSVQSQPGQGSTFYFTIPKRDIPWRNKS